MSNLCRCAVSYGWLLLISTSYLNMNIISLCLTLIFSCTVKFQPSSLGISGVANFSGEISAAFVKH